MFKSKSCLFCLSKYAVKSIFYKRYSSVNLKSHKKLRLNPLYSYFTTTCVKTKIQIPEELKDIVPSAKELMPKERIFKQMTYKDKASFLKIIETFSDKTGRRGHIEFIYSAMRNMEEFNVHCDLEVYKNLMNIFPKGKMIPKNMIQAEFSHFARHQDCAIELLDQMEWNGVLPDKEMGEIILNVFGKSSHVFKKFGRMRYWMSKLINKNPYLPRDPLPSDTEQLARLALKKMSVDPRTQLSHFKTEDLADSLDKTWIVSAQSPVQQKLLLDHPVDKPLYVEGAFLVWLRRLSLSYFILRADPPTRSIIEVDSDDVSNLSLYMFGEPKPVELMTTPKTVHEQEDAMIFGMCATGTSSKDSAVSWIRFLRQVNPVLDNIPILFALKSSPTAVTTVNAPYQKIDDFEEKLQAVAKDEPEMNS